MVVTRYYLAALQVFVVLAATCSTTIAAVEHPEACVDAVAALKAVAAVGRLEEARHRALQLLIDRSFGCSDDEQQRKKAVSEAYKEGMDGFLSASQVAQREQHPLISTEDHRQRNVAKQDDNLCRLYPNVPALSEVDINQLWDDACSMIGVVKHIFGSDGAGNLHSAFSSSIHENLCCEFGPHNPWTYLRLPALEEPAIRLRIPFGDASSQSQHFTLDLEQDGFLRPFQVDSVLWPSGYLLSLCLGNLWECVPEARDLLQKRSRVTALELGCGIGAPSIAMAKHLNAKNTTTSIVATDFSPFAPLLTESNSRYNHVANIVHTAAMDHFNATNMQRVVHQYTDGGNGFDVVYGSSLQGLFVDTHKDDSPLWQAMDILLHSDGLAILAHTRHEDDKLRAPSSKSSYALLYCKSGSETMFGPMTTRHSDSESDFEVCVFRRRGRNEESTAAEL